MNDDNYNELKQLINAQSEESRRHMEILKDSCTDQTKTIAVMFTGLEKKVDGHTEMIGQIMEDVQEIKANLTQKVDLEEFTLLERRVITLETKLVAR